MSKPKDILDELAEDNPDAMVFPEFEDALLGMISTNNITTALYSYEGCVNILKKDMSEDEAHEWMSYNVEGVGGEFVPSFLTWE